MPRDRRKIGEISANVHNPSINNGSYERTQTIHVDLGLLTVIVNAHAMIKFPLPFLSSCQAKRDFLL